MEGEKGLLTEQTQVLGERFASSDGMGADDFDRAIYFRHALFKPQRPKRVVVPKQQMRVFVQDGLQRNRIRQRKHNQIFLTASMEKGGQIRRFTITNRAKWAHRINVREGDYDNRGRSDGLSTGQQGVSQAKLFKAGDQS